MNFENRYPDYLAIEQIINQARLERSVYVGQLIASAIVAFRNAVNGLSDRTIRASKIQWRPDVPLGKVPVGQD